MGTNANGVYSLPPGSLVEIDTIATPDSQNIPLQDIKDALTARVTRDGSGSMTGALKMGANQITGLADGTTNQHAATVGQVTAAVDAAVVTASEYVDDEVAAGNLVATIAQALDAAQKAQANANIGSVSYAEQAPTTEQKTQARLNIGAIGDVYPTESNPGLWLGFVEMPIWLDASGMTSDTEAPEIGAYFRMLSDGGGTDPTANYKVALAAHGRGTVDSGAVYAFNAIAEGYAGAGGYLMHAIEADVNNFGAAAGDVGSDTAAYAFLAAAGFGASTAAYFATSAAGSWQYGFAARAGITGSFLYDETAAASVLVSVPYDEVGKVNGIDFSGQTFSGAAWSSPGITISGDGTINTEQAVLSAGLQTSFDGTYSWVMDNTAADGGSWSISNISGAGPGRRLRFYDGEAEREVLSFPSTGGVTFGDLSFDIRHGGWGTKVYAGANIAPGTNGAAFYVAPGTTAGTAKLVMLAGTSNTPTVIADNVGSGF